ncbi:glycine zipper family protein [Polynucleobacter acidiphobus]|uniref:glycine zipper family protein n=1 Tax=Polynucleobacter acidiphobus TaxID=556053 RepID=UPI001F169315|nr:glycine zipper family protein [Polynucleobacter acidiphobus]
MNLHPSIKVYFIPLTALLLTACAGADVRPIVDMKGVNEARYEKDLAECQNYAKEASSMGSTAAKGAGAGAVVGGLLGLVTGGNTTGIVQAAGAGAVIGGAGGAYKGNESQEAIVKKCLAGRGYKVLN